MARYVEHGDCKLIVRWWVRADIEVKIQVEIELEAERQQWQ